MKGYIYKLELKDNELKDFIKKNLGENLICIPESLDFYEPLSYVPDDLKSKGRAFSEKGEIRWEKYENKFIVILLTETLKENQPDFQCEVEELEFSLFSLEDKRINPKFERYPTGKKDGKLKTYVYIKDGMPLTIRLRSIL